MHILAALSLGVSSLAGAGLAGTGEAAAAAPAFQMPFPCNQTWTGTTSSSAHRTNWEIDFNRGGSPNGDLGDTVVAAAAGTVVMSEHRGSKDGFGNVIKIRHSGGLDTVYAHLNSRSVGAGATVRQGQTIGTVGRTTKPSRKGMIAHLHYEVRASTGSWPGNVRPATFAGRRFGYPSGSATSKNCGGGTPPVTNPTPTPKPNPNVNPHTPEKVCGSGYKRIDSASLSGAGTVYLLYSAAAGKNCVATMKATSIGKASPVSAYLQVQGKAQAGDSGNFSYYAGPVRASAVKVCVKWGGSIGSAKYDSPLEHCD
ncbi:M23 family metallopeptidase [Streptosporangium sp. KLBMP 9127]|nr:M23 family metallopeptidase [Streptosporangium sp. KLBMP 9127]